MENEIPCVFGILNCVLYADTLLIWGTGTGVCWVNDFLTRL